MNNLFSFVRIGLFKNYSDLVGLWAQTKLISNRYAKVYKIIYNISDFLTSGHKMTQDGLTYSENQWICIFFLFFLSFIPLSLDSPFFYPLPVCSFPWVFHRSMRLVLFNTTDFHCSSCVFLFFIIFFFRFSCLF